MDLFRSVKRHLSTKKISFHEKYELGEVLGQGSYAQVRLGRDRLSKEQFAIKIFDLRLSGRSSIDPELVECVKIEAALNDRVGRHPNCVQMFNCFLEKNLNYMVMEKCKCSLMDAMRDQPKMIETKLVSIFWQGLQGLAHCHDAGLVHRDVKPENFLLGGQCGSILKLCDFGLADTLGKKGYCKGIFGTAPYMSPELLNKEHYDCKTDVWSFAVVVYLILFGKYPYEPKVRNADEMKRVILKGEPKPVFSQEAPGCFASDLLKRNPKVRFTAREALEHQFLKPKLSLQRSWTSESLKPAAKLARAVSKEFKAPLDPGRTQDLNDLLDDLQERGEQFHLADAETVQEQCTITGDEATEGYIVEMVHKHNAAEKLAAEKLGPKTLILPGTGLPAFYDSEYANRSTQVATNETLPELNFVSEASSQDEEKEPFEQDEPVKDQSCKSLRSMPKSSDDGSNIWDPALWTV